jgi:hypothetical protein
MSLARSDEEKAAFAISEAWKGLRRKLALSIVELEEVSIPRHPLIADDLRAEVAVKRRRYRAAVERDEAAFWRWFRLVEKREDAVRAAVDVEPEDRVAIMGGGA